MKYHNNLQKNYRGKTKKIQDNKSGIDKEKNMSFKDKVDSFMKKNNIPNLKQFALQANIPYTTLRDVYDKQDMSNFRISTISKLSAYMNCSIEYLLSDNEKVMNENKLEFKVDEKRIGENMDNKTITDKELIQKVIEYLYKKFSDNQITDSDIKLFELIYKQ